MNSVLAKAVSTLGMVLLVAVCGCQSMERMSRPDAEASLERPDDWPREQDEELRGVLFQIRHPHKPVQMRLRRLELPVVSRAHSVWALMWLDELYDQVDGVDTTTTKLGGHRATRLDALLSDDKIADDHAQLRVEMLVVNAGADSFVLESWGTDAAMEDTAEIRRQVVQSLQLPAQQADSSGGDSNDGEAPAPLQITADGWHLELPAPADSDVREDWQRDQHSDTRIVFSLPSRLIEGEIASESLPYPIGAGRYAKIALELDAAPPADDPHDLTHRVDDDSHRVPMVHTYRFVTRGERAVQVLVSTPKPLYDNNRALVEEVVDSLVAKVEQAEKPAGSHDQHSE